MTIENPAVIRILRMVVETIRPQFTVELWDGTRIGSFDGPVLLINDPSVVRQLLLKPNYDSLIDRWASGRIDIKDGTSFDLASRKIDGHLKERIRALPQSPLLKDVPSLLFSRKRQADFDGAGKSPFA